MAAYECSVEWSRGNATFTDLQYSRAHEWSFDGGAVVVSLVRMKVSPSRLTYSKVSLQS